MKMEIKQRSETNFVSKNIRKYRKTIGYSQEKCARLAGVALNTWYRWEKGKRNPSLNAIIIISRVLNTPLPQLMENNSEH